MYVFLLFLTVFSNSALSPGLELWKTSPAAAWHITSFKSKVLKEQRETKKRNLNVNLHV